jgi:hypothetical protein
MVRPRERSRLGAVAAMLGVTLLVSLDARGATEFQHTTQLRQLLGSASVNAPSGPDGFESDSVFSQALADFDVTFDLISTVPDSNALASMLVSQQSSADPTRIDFATGILTSMITPTSFACSTNASTFFNPKFVVDVPTPIRIRGTMNGGAPATAPGFVTGNVLLLSVSGATLFHRHVQDGELDSFDVTLTLPAGTYNLQFECHGGLSNLTPQHPQLNDFASLDVDISLTIVIPGDLDSDGSVNALDLSIFLGAWSTDDEAADLNGDGVVDAADLAILLSEWTG